MLRSLHIKNLAIVERATVEFGRGLNVVTGETGAGKSILAGALALVLGERADKSLIRSGEDSCTVEAEFALSDPEAVNGLLDELGLEPCEDGRLLIRRVFSAGSAGKCLINDSSVTVQALKRLGDLLVDLCGPHDHQSLLSRAFQLDLLDAYGHLWGQREKVEELHREIRSVCAARDELAAVGSGVESEVETLTFQIKELEDAGFVLGEDEQLDQEHRQVSNASRIGELAGAVSAWLTEADDSAFDRMALVQKSLAELAGLVPAAESWLREAESLAIQMRELSAVVQQFASSIDADPARLEWLDGRLALLHKLKRKYGGGLPAMQDFLVRAKARLVDLSSREARIAELDGKLKELGADYRATASKLSSQRKRTAAKLASEVTSELTDLGFKQAEFSVVLERGEESAAGVDAVEFGFAPNAGESMRALRAIASSGEMSRVMLALKTAVAQHDRIPVLVFDEIDANVGGETGNALGEKLAVLGGHHQVLCITHLPQVAVYGGSHLVVDKTVSGGRTVTRIAAVEGAARVEEIARMLGGRDITSVTLRHAKEMLARCVGAKSG